MKQRLPKLLLAGVLVWFIHTYGFSQRLDQKVDEFVVAKGPLTTALQDLQRATRVNLLYDASSLRDKEVEAQQFKNESVGTIIQKLTRANGLETEERQGVIVIRPVRASAPTTQPQTSRADVIIDIRGRITDKETREGLAGVNIVVRGTTTGTITDREGNFVLTNVRESDVLVISMIGYKTTEVVVGAQTTITIEMETDISMLGDVVVVGYGETNRSELTSSITSVTPKDFNRGVVGAPDQLLNGRVAGLNITRNGDPNANPSVLLRGPSTLRTGEAQEPFYVIDGVPGASIRLVNPDDIVSIEVFKDAAATAIYGNRAANGVIMITTRKAKPTYGVSYTGYVGVENVANKIDVMSGDELRDYLRRNNRTLDFRNNDYTLNGQDTVWTNTNWQDAIMRTGVSHNHTITYGGGTEQALFNASVNYFKNEGIIRFSSNERLIAKVSLEQKAINDRLTMNFQVTNSLVTQNLIPDGVFRQMVSYLPTVDIYNEDGSFKEETVVHTSNYFNPLGILTLNQQQNRINTLLAFAQLRFRITDNLQWNINGSLQNETSNRRLYQDSRSIYPISFSSQNPYVVPPSFSGQAVGGLAKRSSIENRKNILETFLEYNLPISDAHDLKVMAGYSYQEDVTGDGFQASASGFISNATGSNNLGLGSTGAAVDYGNILIQPLRLISLYSRVNYGLLNRYLFQASIRRDGSSAFLGSNRWGNNPAASFAWIINRESFMDGAPVDLLKLRVGYGKTGNSIGFDPLFVIPRYNTAGSFYVNNQYRTAMGSVDNTNPDLRWETTTMTNVGVDFGLFNNKLSGTVEVYEKVTDGLMYRAPVSSALFLYPELLANIGQMKNRGVEITLNVTPLVRRDFRWDLTAVWAHNKNEITRLSNATFRVDSIPEAPGSGAGVSGVYTQIIREGYPIGTFNLYRWVGRNEAGISTFLTPDGRITDTPVFPADAHIMGNAQPKFTYGLSNSFFYRNWSLSIFLRGVYGNDILNSTRAVLSSISQAHLRNIPRSAADEPMTDVRNNEYSDRWLERGSYLRLDNTTLGYTIPVKNNYIKGASVYVTGQNLFVITKYTGIDPEVSLGGRTPGFDNNNFYPRTRSFLLGVTLDF